MYCTVILIQKTHTQTHTLSKLLPDLNAENATKHTQTWNHSGTRQFIHISTEWECRSLHKSKGVYQKMTLYESQSLSVTSQNISPSLLYAALLQCETLCTLSRCSWISAQMCWKICVVIPYQIRNWPSELWGVSWTHTTEQLRTNSDRHRLLSNMVCTGSPWLSALLWLIW